MPMAKLGMHLINAYCMAGNFRGVLIFVVFVIDLVVTNFFQSRKLMPTLHGDVLLPVYASP